MVGRIPERMTMDEIMRRWPATIHVVLRYQVLCIGCPVAGFHTVEDAIREHEIDGARFREELNAVIKRSDRPPHHLSRR